MHNERSKKIFKKVMLIFGILTLVLVIHILWVTRPKPVNAYKVIMARIDIKDTLSKDDVAKIQTWLHQQEGVQNVLVNQNSGKAIFTFYPARTSGDQIISRFHTSLHYEASRYLPSEEELEAGCDVLPDNVTKKITSFIKNPY